MNHDISYEVHILTGKFFELGRVYARSISNRIKGHATRVIRGKLTSLAAAAASSGTFWRGDFKKIYRNTWGDPKLTLKFESDYNDISKPIALGLL